MEVTYHHHSLSVGLLILLRRLSLSLVTVGLLVLSMHIYDVPFTEPYKALAIVTALLGLMFASRGTSNEFEIDQSGWQMLTYTLISWGALVAALLVSAYVTSVQGYYSQELILTWLAITLPAIFIVRLLIRVGLFQLSGSGRQARRTVLVGGNELSTKFLRRIENSARYNVKIQALFDDRDPERFPEIDPALHAGRLADIAEYVQKNQIDAIIVALPIANLDRVAKVLDDLRDTTASIYYLPNVFVYDLIQCRSSNVGGMPIVALCETPFFGLRGIAKRFTDVIIASGALVALSPVLLAVAALVKLSSPGPAIFKQRRFGMDGREIVVYKFRTMTVTEDGDKVTQATRDDARITPIGAKLRKYSLDELPQFFNVLQGRMSVVGPRPHAVSHNEYYRKLIDGYMIRHKVPPGITGLAQVSGMRGETATVEDMRNRIEFDLAYLRNWSIGLDMQIIFQTVALMFRDEAAY